MAYDQRLADKIRAHVGRHPDLTEKQMFGGNAFMIGGNMAVGVSGDELMMRVGKEAHDEAEAKPGARIFDLAARPMRGWVVVAPEGFPTDADLENWIQQGVSYAKTLPRK
ncbi:MAG: TfoX/Sxy family protein [Acidimicrobiia bacterium]